MKFLQVIVLSVAVMSVVSCDKKSDGDDGKNTFASLGGDVSSNTQVFINMMSAMENPVGFIKVSPMDIINKTDILDNSDYGAMVSTMMTQFNFLNLDQPIMVGLSASDDQSITGVVMLGVNDKDKLVKSLKAYGEDFIAGIESKENGYEMVDLKMGDGQYAQMAITDHLAVITIHSGFMNAEDSEKNIEILLSSGMTETNKLPTVLTQAINTNKDLVLCWSPESVLEIVGKEKAAEVNVGLDRISDEMTSEDFDKMMSAVKDGWTTGSLNFEEGMIAMEMINDYPESPEFMNLASESMPVDYAYLLTNNQLVGFGGGKIDISNFQNLLKNSGENKIYDEFKEKTGLELGDVIDMFDGSFSLSMVGIPNVDEMVASVNEDGFENGDDGVESGFDKLGESTDTDDEPMPEEPEEKKLINKAQNAAKNMLVTFGISNEEMLRSILDTAKAIYKVGDMYMTKPSKDSEKDQVVMFMAIKNNRLMLSGDQETIIAFNENGKLKMAEVAGKYMQAPFNGYVSFETIASILLEAGGQDSPQMLFLEKMDVLELSGDMKKMTLKIKTKNVDDNVLKQIADYILNDSGVIQDVMGAVAGSL